MTIGNIRDAIRAYLALTVSDKKIILEELELNEINRIADSLLIDRRKFYAIDTEQLAREAKDEYSYWNR